MKYLALVVLFLPSLALAASCYQVTGAGTSAVDGLYSDTGLLAGVPGNLCAVYSNGPFFIRSYGAGISCGVPLYSGDVVISNISSGSVGGHLFYDNITFSTDGTFESALDNIVNSNWEADNQSAEGYGNPTSIAIAPAACPSAGGFMPTSIVALPPMLSILGTTTDAAQPFFNGLIGLALLMLGVVLGGMLVQYALTHRPRPNPPRT
jgi:hypothetical protein